jgi:mannose-6-phosphate isomerase-like protein (cupin superfamily)
VYTQRIGIPSANYGNLPGMADEVNETIEGEGFTVSSLDALGEGLGFRKIRKPLGVTAFGANAIVLPPGYATNRHAHEKQEELYFVHRGTIELEVGEAGSAQTFRLGEGGVARVAPEVPRRLRNVGDGDATYVSVGGLDGYVGRDASLVGDEQEATGGFGK